MHDEVIGLETLFSRAFERVAPVGFAVGCCYLEVPAIIEFAAGKDLCLVKIILRSTVATFGCQDSCVNVWDFRWLTRIVCCPAYIVDQPATITFVSKGENPLQADGM